MAIFEGAGVALVTPFKENGEVNYEKLEELVEEQIENHTDCIVAAGTTGEASTMTEEEHIETIRFVCQVVNGRVPVIAGTGANCTKTASRLSEEAEEAGADGVLVVSPYYNKATQGGLKAHFTQIAKSVKIPVVLYNIPSRTGINIEPETIVDLCKNVENIVDVEGSRRLQLKARPLIHALFSEVNPIPVKAAMNLMGKAVGDPRLPLTVMEPKHQEILKRELEKFGIL